VQWVDDVTPAAVQPDPPGPPSSARSVRGRRCWWGWRLAAAAVLV